MDNNNILFLVKTKLTDDCDDVVIVAADGREEAKRLALPTLGAYADHYVVTPLTKPDDRVMLNLNVRL